MTDRFIDAVKAMFDSEPHLTACDAAPHTYFGAICDCRAGGCNCDREARIIEKIAKERKAITELKAGAGVTVKSGEVEIEIVARAEARYDEARAYLERQHPELFREGSNATGTEFVRAADALRASAPRQETKACAPDCQFCRWWRAEPHSFRDVRGELHRCLDEHGNTFGLTDRIRAILDTVAAPPPKESR